MAFNLTNLPTLLAALGNNLALALITQDGVTFTAAIVSSGMPNTLYSGSGPTQAAALSALAAAVTNAAAANATGAANVSSAVQAATGLAPVVQQQTTTP